MYKKENNYAFIDGQNLHLGVIKNNWSINYQKLKIYLKDKHRVSKIFYFWGYYNAQHNKIYTKLSELGYISIFKEHNIKATSTKKGNVDSNIIFEIMKKINSKECFDKIVLISGDGDFKKIVNYLMHKNKFKKILFPNRKSVSNLYKKLNRSYVDYIEHFKNDISI
jgi:uncharacterized LabA/DUF88 family protein